MHKMDMDHVSTGAGLAVNPTANKVSQSVLAGKYGNELATNHRRESMPAAREVGPLALAGGVSGEQSIALHGLRTEISDKQKQIKDAWAVQHRGPVKYTTSDNRALDEILQRAANVLDEHHPDKKALANSRTVPARRIPILDRLLK